jgi:hypothetical protein
MKNIPPKIHFGIIKPAHALYNSCSSMHYGQAAKQGLQSPWAPGYQVVETLEVFSKLKLPHLLISAWLEVFLCVLLLRHE